MLGGRKFNDHSQSSLVVNVECGRAGTNGFKFLYDISKILDYLGAGHSCIELGIGRTCGYTWLY